jgi:hypothetical protein
MTIVALAATIVAGCASAPPRASTPETHVAYHAHISADAPRYEEREDEVSTSPQLIENPAPIYPPSAIPLHLPHVAVEAKVVVDEGGHVAEVRVAPMTANAPRPVEFDAAVRDAAMRWRFAPLTFTRWQYVEDAQGNTVDSRKIASENRPFSLDYTFSFDLRDGKPVTAIATSSAARRD